VYDANDNITVATAANGAVSTTEYDAADQVLSVFAPVDNPGDPPRKTSYTYDNVGNVLTATEPNGNLTGTVGDFVTTNNYDEIYQLLSTVDAGGNRMSYEYDNVGNVITEIDGRKSATPDPADFTTKYGYDRDHRITTITDALGKPATISYDRDGNVVARTDRGGVTTRLTLNARAMPVEMTIPHENGTDRTTRYEYDQVGNRTKVTSPRGVDTTNDDDDFAEVTVYDELNRVKETWTPYDQHDPRVPTPDKTIYTYDAASRLTTLSAPPSWRETVRNDTVTTYFDNGWVRTSTDPWNIVTSYDYDDLGAQTLRVVTSAGGSSSRTMSWQYYPDGKLKARADDGVPVGKQVVLVDNSDFNNTSSTGTWTAGTTAPGKYGPNYQTHAAGTGTDTFTWGLNIPQGGTYEVFVSYPNVSGAATDATFTVTHAGGSTDKTVNQAANSGTWVSLGSFGFTEGGNHKITLRQRGTGTVVADAVKLVRNNSGETDAEKYEYTYRYDANGNQTTVLDKSLGALVDTYSVDYNALNQVKTVRELKSEALKNTSQFTYNEIGLPVTATHDKQYASYTYDARDFLSTVVNGKTATDPNAKTTRFTYNDRGQRLRMTKGNGNTVDHSYYLDGLPHTQVERKADGTLVADHAVDYDLNGNRIRDVAHKMNADDHASQLITTDEYTYDPRDRLVTRTKTGPGAGSESYQHDANNNVITQTVNGVPTTFNYDRNRLLTSTTSGVTAAYNYDPFGRLDTVTAAGQLIERDVYDGFDHILENRRFSGGTLSTTRYTYDPFDRTTTRTTNAGTANAKTTTFAYLGLSTEVLEELSSGGEQVSYQYTPFGERLSQIKVNADGSTERTYYGYNQHSDVEQVTDDTGNTKATYGYSAYGSNDEALFTGADKPDASNPSKEPYNSYRFNAKRWDQASGTYDMGFRDYSPGLNRFLTRDTYNGALSDLGLSLDPWTGNRYAFGGGNPISVIEFDGHCGWSPTSWGDCLGDAAGWVGDQLDSAWDATWDFGADLVSDVGDFLGDVGDFLSDVGDWIVHNADALLDIALDVVEIVAGVAAVFGGIELVIGGVAACAASTPLVLTGVGAIVTGGVCWGGLAMAAGGVLLAGLGIVAIVHGGSNLGRDIGRLESTGGKSNRIDPPRRERDGKVHGDLPDHVPDHWTREQLEDLEDDLERSIAVREAEQRRLGEDPAHRRRIEEERQLLRQVQKKLSGS
jgi:RHS repeat-associated protein